MPDSDRSDREAPADHLVRERPRNLEEKRSIKLKLPLRHHIRLHAMRLHTGENLSATVAAALDLYFEHRRQEELAARAAGRAPDGHVEQLT